MEFKYVAGELLEVFITFNKAGVRAVKPLKYGLEKVQTFTSYTEDAKESNWEKTKKIFGGLFAEYVYIGQK